MIKTSNMSIIWPIIRREIQTRFGTEGLSYFWALVVPLSWIGFGILAFKAFDRSLPIATEPALFLATGIMPYVIFRQTVLYIVRSVHTAKTIRILPGIRFHHLAWGYALLEGLTCVLLVIILFTALNIMPTSETPDKLLFFISILLLTWVFGTMAGFILSRLSVAHKWILRVLPLSLRPLFWISGVFFIARELPTDWRYILSFNPLFILTDFAREAYFQSYTSPLSWIDFLFSSSAILAILIAFSLLPQQSEPMGDQI